MDFIWLFISNLIKILTLLIAEKYGGGKLVGQAAGMLGLGSQGNTSGASNYSGGGAYGPGPNTGSYGT